MKRKRPQDHVAATVRILYLFAGKERKADLRDHIITLLGKGGSKCKLIMHEVDIARSGEHDLLNSERCAKFVEGVRRGDWDICFVTPPCNSWSRATWSSRPGPLPCRAQQWPWGFPWASE